ncbi:MAG: hypothetical protein ABIM99_03845 [Candidatus Dojkabacteria bacterium]
MKDLEDNGPDFRSNVQRERDNLKVTSSTDGFEETIKFFTTGGGKDIPVYEKIPYEIRKRIEKIRNGEDPNDDGEEHSILDDFLES